MTRRTGVPDHGEQHEARRRRAARPRRCVGPRRGCSGRGRGRPGSRARAKTKNGATCRRDVVTKRTRTGVRWRRLGPADYLSHLSFSSRISVGSRRTRLGIGGDLRRDWNEASESGLDGQHQVGGQHHEVYAALQAGRPPGHDRQHADHRGQGEQHDVGRCPAPGAAGRRARSRPPRSSGWSGRCWPSPTRSARLRLIWVRSRRAALTAAIDSGSSTSRAMITPTTAWGRPSDFTASSIGCRLDLGQADHRHQRDEQQGEADAAPAGPWVARRGPPRASAHRPRSPAGRSPGGARSG